MFLIILSISTEAEATDTKDTVSLIAGIGNYEYLYCGFNFPFSSNYYFETAAGIKPWELSTNFYAMTYVDAGVILFSLKKQPAFKIFLQAKVFLWYSNDEYTRFVFLAPGPEVRATYPLGQRLNLCGSIGVIYNFQIYYERKTYEEVGYPKELQPSFSIQLSYKLK